MYSRETYERGLRIPPRYSGTAFRKEDNITRDAVGRPSALTEEKPPREELITIPKKEITKAPPPSPPERREEEEKPTIQNITKNYSDEKIIGALILSLIGTGKGEEEDITLLLLLLLLIL